MQGVSVESSVASHGYGDALGHSTGYAEEILHCDRKEPLKPPNDSRNKKRTVREDALAGLGLSPKSLPTRLVYGTEGSDVFEKVKDTPEHYLCRAELKLLEGIAAEVVQHFPPGAVIIELGCGSAPKTHLILEAIMQRHGSNAVHWEGIDCSQESLAAAPGNILAGCPSLPSSSLNTICALYVDGLRQACQRHPDKPRCCLWLGNSIGNCFPAEAQQLLRDVCQICGPETQMLFAADRWKDEHVLHAAYNDKQGLLDYWARCALRFTFGALCVQADVDKWAYRGLVNHKEKQMEMWLYAPEAVDCGHGIHIAKGEGVLILKSRKFTGEQIQELASASGWQQQAQWTYEHPLYSMHLWIPAS